jgi:hypothetical protein
MATGNPEPRVQGPTSGGESSSGRSRRSVHGGQAPRRGSHRASATVGRRSGAVVGSEDPGADGQGPEDCARRVPARDRPADLMRPGDVVLLLAALLVLGLV